TTLPSALTSDARLRPFASPRGPTLTRLVVPAARSRTKMSWTPFQSPRTRFVAADGNATTAPSALIDGLVLGPSLSASADEILTRDVHDVRRSRTKTSRTRFRSSGTRFVAADTNATYRPLALSTAPDVDPFACAPLVLTFTRSVSAIASASAARTRTVP